MAPLTEEEAAAMRVHQMRTILLPIAIRQVEAARKQAEANGTPAAPVAGPELTGVPVWSQEERAEYQRLFEDLARADQAWLDVVFKIEGFKRVHGMPRT